MTQATTTRSMRTFSIIWFSQLIPLIGSGLASFALGVWVYERTGSATQFALISFFTMFPSIALSPLAGVLVDRWDRRLVMICASVGVSLSLLALATLFYTGLLHVWHIHLGMTAISACNAFQWPT